MTDGYLLAYTLITLFMLIVSMGFNNAFLPLYTKYKKTDPKNAETNATAMLNWTTLLFVLFGVGMYFVIPWMAPMLSTFIDKPTLSIAIKVGKFYCLFLFLFALTGLLESYLQARYRYVPTHLAKICGTVGSALFGWLFAETMGIISFAYGFAAGTVIGVIIQLLSLFQARYRWTPQWRLDKKYVNAFTVLFIPSLLNTVVGPINTLIDRLFAAGSIGGAVTYLNNAALLVSIPNTIYITTIGAIIFSLLTDSANKTNDFHNLLSRGLKASLIIFIPMATGFVIVGDDVIEFIYERGAFTATDTHWTYLAVLLYSPMIVTMGIQEVISKALYALEKTRVLLSISASTIALNLILNIMFLQWFGFLGLALSSSIVSVYFLLTTVYYLFKQLDGGQIKPMLMATLKILLPTAWMFGALIFLDNISFLNQSPAIIQIIVLTTLGAGIYVGGLYLHFKDGFLLMKDLLFRWNRGTSEH